ncbi:MAG: ABC transporter permease [Bacteroidales bacterium]|nr:ABC transporter permease [Bacteroidales bacterium]
MNKLWIIIKREYLSRVKKKSFFVMTILGPILMVLLIVLPVLLQKSTQKNYNIIVVDETQKTVIEGDTISFFAGKYKSNDVLTFQYSKSVEESQQLLKEGLCDGVLEIVSTSDNPPIKAFLFHGETEISLDATTEIKDQTKQIFKNSVLRVNYNMSEQDIKVVNDPKIGFYTKNIDTGEDSSSALKTVLGVILGFVIYFFIFLFGSQVMRSVGEEKSSRIIEVLASSVKSVYLLFGKIIATALLGLTQIALWIVLTFIILGGISLVEPNILQPKEQSTVQISERVVNVDAMDFTQEEPAFIQQAMQEIQSINFPLIISMFVVYFLLGYLLYGSLFGAVGALIDNDTDNSQFTLPVTVPLILAIICVPMVMSDPSGGVAFWLSIIPFTSPIIMLIRLPFGIPVWQLSVSIVLLILTIFLCVWIASKIYRMGILMYGKNFTWKEVIKWFKKK